MKKLKNFKILWQYLEEDKFKLILYILLVIATYLPALLASFCWGLAIEYLIDYEFLKFVLFLACWESLYIFFYCILQYPKDRLYTELEIKFMKRVSIDMYKKVQDLPSVAFEEIGVGEFINKLYTDPDRVMELLAKLIKIMCKSVVVIVLFVISFKISIVLFIEIIIFCLTMGIISYKFFPKIKNTQESIKKESDAYVKEATENITGIREIKSLGIKTNILDNVKKRINNLFIHTKKQKKYEILYYCINNLIYFILQFIILFTCGKLFMLNLLSFSLFTVIESYIWRIDEVVESLSDFGVNFNKVSVSLKRIDEILNNKLYDDEKFGKVTLNKVYGQIEFKNVLFKYKSDEDYTLRGLSLKLEPNKKIAIVGKSGNGKSTLFNLLLRYFDSTKGRILIDGINIKSLTEETLRKNISIIRQNPFLFNLSIIDNFKLVKNDITLEEIRKVCKLAYIDDYIMSLPNQYDTIIGEGGVNLSGGQKQRLAIARTLLKSTKIILFDEATSALDNESQEYIKRTIDSLVKDHTIIIVAHRLSTIIDADEIHIIDKGKLVGSGTHDELLKNNEVYKSLYNIELKK